jgi:anti-sigma factor RsiW
MAHPTDSELLAVVHHEPSADLQAHLASCQACQLRYRDLAQQDGAIASLLTLLDAPVPTVTLSGITRRARRGRRARSVAAAAAAILIAASAAATVIPGAPFHPFFRGLVGKSSLHTRPALRPARAPADTAGVTVAGDAEVIIALRHPQNIGEIHLVWQPGAPSVSVRAIGGEVGYTVRTGKVLVENRRPAIRYEIVLPLTVRAMTLLMGNQVLWQSTNPAGGNRFRQPITIDLSKREESKQ